MNGTCPANLYRKVTVPSPSPCGWMTWIVEGPEGYRVDQFWVFHNATPEKRCEHLIAGCRHGYEQGWKAALAAVRDGKVTP